MTAERPRLTEQDGRLIVGRADRHVRITDDFLRRLVGPEDDHTEWVDVTYQGPDHCYSGAVVTIHASNGTATYLIGDSLQDGFWEAERQGPRP